MAHCGGRDAARQDLRGRATDPDIRDPVGHDQDLAGPFSDSWGSRSTVPRDACFQRRQLATTAPIAVLGPLPNTLPRDARNDHPKKKARLTALKPKL